MTPLGTYNCCSTRLPGKRKADYFIFLGNARSVISCIKSFCFNKLTNDRTNFVVHLKTEKPQISDIVQDTLETFWTYNHRNVAVLVEDTSGDIDIYTWFPLDVTPEVKIVEHCDGKSFRYRKKALPFLL